MLIKGVSFRLYKILYESKLLKSENEKSPACSFLDEITNDEVEISAGWDVPLELTAGDETTHDSTCSALYKLNDFGAKWKLSGKKVYLRPFDSFFSVSIQYEERKKL